MAERLQRVLLASSGEFFHIGAFFRKALRNLGYDSAFVDEDHYFRPKGTSLPARTLRRVLLPRARARLNSSLRKVAHSFRPHVILVTNGTYLEPSVLAEIKAETRAYLVNYATDDPFNPSSFTDLVRAAIPLYDLYASTKRRIIGDLKQAGAKRVVWVPFGYEPTLHYPERAQTQQEAVDWASDVVFAGGCDSDRANLLRSLTDVPSLKLHLYGGYWDRYPEFRKFWRTFALGRDYRLALGHSKIALCLVRHANRDDHVMRTFEIPACGAFMLAERTDGHLEFFEEGKEMACFETAEELADKIRYYLPRDEERRRLAEAGHKRVMEGAHSYQHRLEQILRIAQL